MHKYIILPLIAVLSSCGGQHRGDGHVHEGEAAEKHDEHGEIVLHKEVADQFGVVIDSVASGDFATTVRAAGVVLTASTSDAVVSAPTAGIVRLAQGIEAGKALSAGSLVATIDARNVSGDRKSVV